MAVSGINVLNTSVQNQHTFKGKWDKTENGIPYYKTNSGTKTGGVMAAVAGLVWLKNLTNKVLTDEEIKLSIEAMKQNPEVTKMTESIYKAVGIKESPEDIIKISNEASKKQKKYAIPLAAVATGLTLGCGMLVDHLRNKKAKETANSIQQMGVKQAVMNGDNVELSNKGNPYYKSNVGSKYGALLGAGCGIADIAMHFGKKTPSVLILNVLSFAIGGWIMGKIADSKTNNDAQKHA